MNPFSYVAGTRRFPTRTRRPENLPYRTQRLAFDQSTPLEQTHGRNAEEAVVGTCSTPYTLPFARTIRRAYFLFDAGVFRSLRPTGPLDRTGEIDGQALEGLVAQHLRAYSAEDASLFYWRTRAGTEVDFVVYGGTGFHASEVKNAGRVHSADLRALRTFRADYPEADAAVLYRGRDRLRIDGIWCLPGDEFLRQMLPGRGLLEWL